MTDSDFHLSLLGPPREPCRACGAPLAGDQRYCLECGERRGPARLDVLAMARGHAPLPVQPQAPAALAAAPSTGAAGTIAWPSQRAAAAAALLVLGFGIVVGTQAGPHADSTLASARGATIVLGPPPPAPGPTQTSRPGATSEEAASSDPAPEPSQPADEDVAAVEPAEAGEEPVDEGADDPEGSDDQPAQDDEPLPPPIKHAWVVMLTGHTMTEALASPSPTPYLAQLASKGLLLPKYAAVAKGSLANGIALLSGRTPTADHEAGCPTYSELSLQTQTGCVYGADVKTLPGELNEAGRTWRAYVEDSDLGSDPPNSCRHPEPGGPDPWLAPRPGDAYLTQRNPFVFFHAIVDAPDCGSNIAGIGGLAAESADVENAPNMALVVPNACHDGRDQPCADGAPAGLPAADGWLQSTIEPLLASEAYADDGMIVITFDDGPPRPEDGQPAADRPPVGALVLSKHVEAGASVDTAFDHTSLHRTIADAFSLRPLGAAAKDDAKPFGDAVFTVDVTNRSR